MVSTPVFKLLSVESPAFSLTFNVTHRPPTNVTCFVNGTQLNINDEDLIRVVMRNSHNSDHNLSTEVEVTVFIRQLIAGEYRCNITNARIENDDNLYPAITAPIYVGGKSKFYIKLFNFLL